MSVDSAARVSTLKNALHMRKDETVKQQTTGTGFAAYIWKKTSRQIAGVRLNAPDAVWRGKAAREVNLRTDHFIRRHSQFRSRPAELRQCSSNSLPISVVIDARSLSLAHLSELTAESLRLST